MFSLVRTISKIEKGRNDFDFAKLVKTKER